ncbi:hypothetical protein M3Y97_00824900 [Aphelenchoides bicaudatus]|nr:hypothetical protein M3Y97_00824900 [Aphelenchoides bicaudatus]
MASSSGSFDNVTFKQQIVSAATGALVVSLSLTPLDVVKIRLQNQVQPLAKGQCFLFSNGLMDHLCTSCSEPIPPTKCEWFNRPGHFNGTLDAFVKIIRNEGGKIIVLIFHYNLNDFSEISLEWSLAYSVSFDISAIPATVFYFTAYGSLLKQFRKKTNNQWVPPLLAGTIARSSAVFLVSPLEMLRTKMQSELLTLKELKESVRVSVKHDGFFSLWRGLNATLLRDIPFSGIYWSLYENLKLRSLNALGREKTNFPISFACGAISGTTAAIITHPFDVVKTHRQITLGQISNVVSDPKAHISSMSLNKSMFTVFRQILRTDGVSGLYAGITPRLAKVPPACAIMIGTFEHLKSTFSRHNEKLRTST